VTESEKSQKGPKKKRQHFVPKFYLRNFSFDGGAQLHLIHAEDLRAIPEVGLKGQCYDDYFYGKEPMVENALENLEGVTAEVFRAIIAKQRLPEWGTPDDFVFRTFVCLQWGRTKLHAETSEAMFDKMLKTAYGPAWRAKGITQAEIDEVYFGTERPGLFSLSTASEMVPFMGDLESKLVVANGHGEFVVNDAPVVLTNPYLLGRYPGGVTGLNVRGLAMFLPISPQLLAVLYDRKCYRVGSPGARVVPLTCRSDLVAMNNFQFLHADDAVYFRDERMALDYLREFAKVAGMRRKDRTVVDEAFSTMPGDNSSLLISYRADFSYRPALSFLSLLRKRRGETGDVTQIEERNPEVAQLFEQYQRQMKAGVCERGFLDYFMAYTCAKAGLTLPAFIHDRQE
jgi:hypothetical protein